MFQTNITNNTYYKILVRAYEESSKYDKVPFDGSIMYKILKLPITNLMNFNFHSILYHLMEEQEKNGFIITDHMRTIIINHRKKYINSALINKLELKIINLFINSK